MFEVVDDTDDDFDIADNEGGDDNKKRVLGSRVSSLRIGHWRLGRVFSWCSKSLTTQTATSI